MNSARKREAELALRHKCPSIKLKCIAQFMSQFTLINVGCKQIGMQFVSGNVIRERLDVHLDARITIKETRKSVKRG